MIVGVILIVAAAIAIVILAFVLHKKETSQEEVINKPVSEPSNPPVEVPKEEEKEPEKPKEEVVEHKFDVDNWITDVSGRVWHIDDIEDEGYLVTLYEKGDTTILPFTIDNRYSLWTIQNAEDGNMLVYGKDRRPFIFKGLLDKFHPNCPVAYCGIDYINVFTVSTGDRWWIGEEVRPANKKQIDFLFAKMKEVGYEWSDKDRKLIKIVK